MTSHPEDPGCTHTKVAILLSVHNGENFLPELLSSIESQDYKHWSLLVADDGSTDRSREIVQEFCDKHLAAELLEARCSAIGSRMSFATLLEAAFQRDFSHFLFADQDDVWEPSKVSRALRFLNNKRIARRDPALYFSDLTLTDEALVGTGSTFFTRMQHDVSRCEELEYLLLNNAGTGCTMLFNRELAELAIPIPDDAVQHDWWISLVAAAAGKIAVDSESFILYRQHEENEIGAKGFWHTAVKYLESPFSGWKEGQQQLHATLKQALALEKRVGEVTGANLNSTLEDFISINAKSVLGRLHWARRFEQRSMVVSLVLFLRVCLLPTLNTTQRQER